MPPPRPKTKDKGGKTATKPARFERRRRQGGGHTHQHQGAHIEVALRTLSVNNWSRKNMLLLLIALCCMAFFCYARLWLLLEMTSLEFRKCHAIHSMLCTEGFILASLFTSDLDRDKFHRPIQVVKICLIQPKLKSAPAKSHEETCQTLIHITVSSNSVNLNNHHFNFGGV